MRNNRNRGFTLIELMITVVILSVVAAIAYPLYTNYTLQARRAVAHKALGTLATRMQAMWQNRVPRSYPASVASVGMTATTDGNHYTLQVASASTLSYTIQATAVATSPQINDTACTTITLTSSGQKTPAICWKK